LCAAAAAPAVEIAFYRVALDPALTTATVEVSTGGHVTALKSGRAEEIERLQAGSLMGVALVAGELRFPAATKDAERFARYSADLRPTPSRRASVNSLIDMPFALTDPRQWLWLPAEFGVGDKVRVEFVLPHGIVAATPWRVARDSDDVPAFEFYPTMLDQEGLVAFGTMAQREIALGGATLRLSIASADPAEIARFGAWAESVWRVTRSAVAAPPGPIEQLLVVPIKSAREAVPWGEVRRGTGNSVLALVHRNAAQAELTEDWTLYHELSHLYLPYLGGDRWLSEGFASYYQNVLRARAGVLAPEAAWRELAAGLARGAKGAKPEQTVEQGGRMVTYWTGAALALEWDLALRQATGGKQSLDTLLARFAAKELPARAPWGASELAAALDRASSGALGKDYFSASMSRVLAQRGFPDYMASLERAGIDPTTGKARLGTPVMFMALMRPPRSD
jgi:hypothetical protein